MSYHCERCGTHLDDLATQCGCDLPPTKAEIGRARIGHATPIMDAVIAERDRFRADVDARDEVIAEILAMLKPGEMPKYCSFDFQHKYRELYKEWQWKTALHARACEIAGRTE